MKKALLYLILLLLMFGFTAPQKINIWLIGDSTMAAKKSERDPESGWGVELAKLFKDEVVVHNHAASGRSSKSFVREKRWQAVLDSIQPGDYVIIQFGHNDEKPDSLLHTDAATTYKEYLKRFAEETRSKKAIPIICSPIVRRHFNAIGELINTHGNYIDAAKEVALETKTLFIDMEAKSRKLVSGLGSEKSKSLFVFCNPGECRRSSKGVQDSTHLNHYGSKVIASLFISGLMENKSPLINYIK